MLKKIFVLGLVLLTLCGCAKTKTVKPILNDISFTAEIKYGNDDFVCDTVINENTLNLTVSKPEHIKDLSLVVDKNSLSAEFKGVSYSSDINSLPFASLVRILFNILTDISKSDSVLCNDENCKIINSIDGYKYIYIFSPSGLPISLDVDDLSLKILFKNVSLN